MLEVLHERTIEGVEIYAEGSWGTNDLGKSNVIFTIFGKQGIPSMVEMDVGNYGVEHIGLKIENRKIIDYDGVMSFPEHLADILTDMGYDCEEVV